MNRRLTVLAMVVFLGPVQSAAGFTAENGLPVAKGSAGTFVVPYAGRSGPSAFWCAAGDYAIRALGMRPTTVIYRASEPPRRAGEAVRFTLDQSGAASSTGLLMPWHKGAGLSAGHAQSLCERLAGRN